VTDDERAELKTLVAEAVREALVDRTPKKSRTGLLTLEQASEALAGTPTETIRRWIWEGRLKAYKPGKHPLVREADLLALVEANETTAKRALARRRKEA
jgi:excisionase family DNA binding protein